MQGPPNDGVHLAQAETAPAATRICVHSAEFYPFQRMYPFSLFIFHEGREFEFHGMMPNWLQQALARKNFMAWYGFLQGTREQLERPDREHPRVDG